MQIISPLFAISILYFEHAQIIKHPGDRRQVKIHSNLEYWIVFHYISHQIHVAALPTTLRSSTEELYTMWYQTAEMRSLYKSLEEECVKDMLEGG